MTGLSKSTAYRHRRDFVREELNSLHKYVTTLERRIYKLEVEKSLSKIEASNSIIFELQDKQQVFKKVLSTTLTHFKLTEIEFDIKTRKIVLHRIKSIIIYTLSEKFKISLLEISRMFQSKFNFISYERTSFYNIIAKMEDNFLTKGDKQLIADYLIILEKVKST